jgi:cytochrome c553
MNRRARRCALTLSLAALTAAALLPLNSRAAGPDPGAMRGGARGARQDLRSVLSLEPNREHGREVFRLCETCHGAAQTGLPAGWVPEIAGQHPRVIAKQLVDFRRGLRSDVRMEIVAGRHGLKSLRDIADVAAYAGALNPIPASTRGGGVSAERGRTIYEAQCARCHGKAAEGSNTRFVPRLAGQDYQYLLRQLHDAIDGRRPSLAAAHAKALKPLDEAVLEGLAEYASRPRPHAE